MLFFALLAAGTPGRRIARVSKSQIVSIVDDDASVRAAMQSLLRSLGFVAFVFEFAEDFLRSPRVRRQFLSDHRCADAGYERA